MTISSEAIKSSVFSGNGSTVAFAISFKTFDQGDLVVTLTNTSHVEAIKTLTTHYTVSLNSNQDSSPGGTVTMSVAPASGEKLVIVNSPNFTQSTDITNGGAFFANVVEDMVDRNTILARRAQEITGRSIQIPVSDATGTTVALPTETLRANKAIVFSSTGNVGVSVDDYIDQAAASATSASAAAASALVASSAASAVALPFTFSTTTTMADPGSGVVRVNNSSLASVSAIAFDALSADTGSPDISDFLVTWDDSTSTINGHLMIVQEGTPANFAVFAVGAVTDNTGWLSVAVTYVDGGSSLFTNSSKVRCNFTRAGDKGETGSTGSTGAAGSGEGVEMVFESTITDTDQGAAKIFLNHGTVSSATIVYLDDVDSNGASINSLVDSFDDSTSTVKGRLTIKKQLAPENYMIFSFGGSVTSASTYSKLTSCTHVVSAGTISDGDAVFVTFSRTGDKGTTGDTGSTGAQGASVGVALLWDTDTSDADSGAGKVFGNNGTFASISQLYIDDVDSAGTNIEAWIQSLDDSTTTSARGTITLVKTVAQTQIGVFTVTGAAVDGTGYWKIPCSHVFSNVGSLSDGDAVTAVFTRTGNIGATGSTGSTGSQGPQGDAGEATNGFAIAMSVAL